MLKNPCYKYGPRDVSVPAHLNFGEEILARLMRRSNGTAIINGATHEQLTFNEIAQSAMNIAISLTRIGLRKGDVVAICSENQQDVVNATVGIICSGGILTAMNFGYSKGEIKHVMNISKPKYIFISQNAYKKHKKTLNTLPFIKNVILFGDERHGDNVLLYRELVLPAVNGIIESNVIYEEFETPDVNGETDTVIILYSSGTTGLPKGVMLTHLNLLSFTCAIPQVKIDRTLMIAPWYHVMGLVGFLRFLCYGWTSIYIPKFDINLYLDTIEKYKVEDLVVVPPVLVALCKYQSTHDVSSVKSIFCGAAPLHRDVINAVHVRFPKINAVYQGYGMTESTYGIVKDTGEAKDAKRGGVGKTFNNCIVKVVDVESRQPLGSNQDGEICIKGPMVMKGYIGKDRSSDFDDEGFFKTGDIGYYDNDGYFFIKDRIKELIKYKGYQVPPAEIESVLLQHESVRNAGVVGIEDKEAGEVPMAFVVLQPGKKASEKELKDFVAERLSNPKHLRGGIRFVDELPMNPSGKILRRHLRDMAKKPPSKL